VSPCPIFVYRPAPAPTPPALVLPLVGLVLGRGYIARKRDEEIAHDALPNSEMAPGGDTATAGIMSRISLWLLSFHIRML
jgi:hypothetical protein